MTHRRQAASDRPPRAVELAGRPRVGDLQSLAGNRAVAGLLGPRSIQRDTDYDPLAPYRGWNMQRLMGLGGAGGGSVSSGVGQGVGAAASVAATAADIDPDPDPAPGPLPDPAEIPAMLKAADTGVHLFEDVGFMSAVDTGVEVGTAVSRTASDIAQALPFGRGGKHGKHDAAARFGQGLESTGDMLKGFELTKSFQEQQEFNEAVDTGAGVASALGHEVSGFLGELPFVGGGDAKKPPTPHRDPAPWPGSGTSADPYQLPPLIFGKDGSMQEGTGAPGDPIILPPYYGNEDDKAVDGRK